MVRIFKIIILFQVFLGFQLFAQYTQEVELNENNIENVPLSLLNNVSMHLDKASLQYALNEISEKGAVKLSYNRAALPLEAEISIDAENVATIEVLLSILEQSSSRLQITKSGSLIILPAKKEVPTGKIKGTVVDANSGEALIGANVIIQGTSIGAAANIDGEFMLTDIEPGEYTLKISYVGYKDKTEKVTVISNRATEITVNLSWVAVEGKEVVVTAQAKGQLAAINEQLSSNEIKNVVSKDKIRELPDANAAESVGRLPGISLARSGGEGYGVIIRGLQPKYSKIMVDGVALSATGSNDRTVSMSSISSYSLEGIEVIKSPTADMDGDQVGGSVNMKMRTAPSGLKTEVIAEGGYRQLRNKLSDYNFVGTASDRFFKDKLGVFAQATIDGKDMGSNRMSASYYIKNLNPNILNELSINGLYLTNDFSYRKRYGGTLTLDYLIPDGKVYFKNFLSSSFSDGQNYTEYYGTSQREFQVRDYDSERLMFTNIFGYEQYLSIFKVNAKLSHTHTSGETPNNIYFRFRAENDMNHFEGDTAPEDIPSYAKNVFDDFKWASADNQTSKMSGTQIMAQLDLETDFKLTKQITGKIKFGGKFIYDERSYDYEKYNGNPNYAGSNYTEALVAGIDRFNDLPGNSRTYPYSLFIDNNFSHGEFLNGAYELGPVADIEQLHQIIDIMEGVRQEVGNAVTGYQYLDFTSQINDYSGSERLGAGYLMAELNITKNLTFIPGVRYEAKQTTYNGVYGYNVGLEETKFNAIDTTSQRNNDFWLPMIHLKYEPFDWLQVRLAYTKTLARPNFTDIIPNMYYYTNGIKMRNVNLRPELAESYDLYFAFSDNYLGLLTVGGFYKNIEDKIFSRGSKILTNPEEYGIDPKYKGYKYSTQENNETVSVSKGFEVDWQTNFWYLPSFLKGFVLNVNYTKIYSETVYPKHEYKTIMPDPSQPWITKDSLIDKSYTDRLLGQPDAIVNVALGYDYKDFSIRVSMNYTTDVFNSTNFYPAYRILSNELTLWDLSVKQKLPWYGLQVYCNVTNFTRAIEKTHRFSGNKPSTHNYYGSNATLGVIWRLGEE